MATPGFGMAHTGHCGVRSWEGSLEPGRDPWFVVLPRCWHRAKLGVPTCCRHRVFRNKQQLLLPLSCSSRLSPTPGSPQAGIPSV